MDNFLYIKEIDNKEELAKFLSDNIFIIFKSSLTKKKFFEETLKFLNEIPNIKEINQDEKS